MPQAIIIMQIGINYTATNKSYNMYMLLCYKVKVYRDS